jgi:transcriptional regulator with XRE-family HTH domain
VLVGRRKEVLGVVLSEARQNRPSANDHLSMNVGDVWSSDAGPLLLVLTPPVPEAGSRWLEAVPVDRRTDLASDVDLLLVPSESTLGSGLRVRWADQLFVRADRLRNRQGQLDAAGWKLIEAALNGVAPEQRFGSPHTREDERAVADDEDAPALDTLRADHRAVLAEREAAFELGFGAGLARIRSEKGITRASLSKDVASQLQLSAAAAAIKRRLADLERGSVPPRGLRKRLVTSLARALGVDPAWLDGLRKKLPEPGPSIDTAQAFARVGDEPGPAKLEQPPSSGHDLEAVDDLFFGGTG